MKFAIAMLFMLFAFQSHAETVRIPVGQQEKPGEFISTPATGTTKASVKTKYGEPMTQQGPVGEPPIYTWTYSDFVVYFESDRVVHSVIKFTPKVTDAGSTP
ncbi:hypothetical protein [uncultured Gilvimarinus sp.]|uniref:hypothetical protein n=1 Tax=uncultured Gilvimarinus sp. TaxID=1689143 RepID=UPI0030EC5F17|tara:strand:+ start:265 stop:570 length:306 start_codon:yes stop_codon:yes gene_type:complete